MRKRHRFNRRMTRIVLLISFLFFFGRFVYSSIGAWYHHQDKKASHESSLTVEPSPRE
ncbi:YfgG family protein [Klebsiella pneumoniae]|uniref:YfgG family protein n=1 Tax=Klebsiella pneumoniae TaxID=573 RepID=UPI0032E54C3D